MIQYRRIAGFTLGAWLGAAVFADFAVTENFRAVDRFLRSSYGVSATADLGGTGRERLRPLLRRSAGEENNVIFSDWETAELILGAVLIGLLLADHVRGRVMSLAAAMLAIVAVQRFYLSPEVASLGRQISELPPDASLNSRFWTLHSAYSGLEIAKLFTGLLLVVPLLRGQHPRESAWKAAVCARIAGPSSQRATGSVPTAAFAWGRARSMCAAPGRSLQG